MIEIWNPRWHDRKVLIAKYKVHYGINRITFTKAKQLKQKVYCMDGADIAKYPIETNGTIECYSIPLDELLKRETKV
jgi:hypothetical protein